MHRTRRCLVLLVTAWTIVAAPCPLDAATKSFPEFVDPNPAPGNGFGSSIVVLTNGDVVITSPGDDRYAANAGAVYRFDGDTGELMFTLRGEGSQEDEVGSGWVHALPGGGFLVHSPSWDGPSGPNAGAVTFVPGSLAGEVSVSETQSLFGTSSGDLSTVSVQVLSGGDYVLRILSWNNGAAIGAGAITWGSGTTGVVGFVSPTNSLVGTSPGDLGSSAVVTLTNGNYVVASPDWDNGGVADAGAVTWCNGTTGRTGTISSANSFVGTRAGDAVGWEVQPLPGGNYVVISPWWDSGTVVDVGAITWCNGTTGRVGVVSTFSNSRVGVAAGDALGSAGIQVLTNGKYVVRSPSVDGGINVDVGAVTLCPSTVPVTGTLSVANSLLGTSAGDVVGEFPVIPLANGNYIVTCPRWDNGTVVDAGAATWGSGVAGVTGFVSASNSLVGTSANDRVSVSGVLALSNGNYVVLSGGWSNGALAAVGAATWCDGSTGRVGAVSVSNSLIGTAPLDAVGAIGIALSNGNYVVHSPLWDRGSNLDAGAVTWGSGQTGVQGPVSFANSLVGVSQASPVGMPFPLPNGNYVVVGETWDEGPLTDLGAVTLCSGSSSTSGEITSSNSLVGTQAGDMVGSGGIRVLANGNYVVGSPLWDNGSANRAGALTWCGQSIGLVGRVSEANSIVGSSAQDVVGALSVVELSDGNYVVPCPNWRNGTRAAAGAVVWGDGNGGTHGPVSAANSVVGWAAQSGMDMPIKGDQGTFVCRFAGEGRVRVGPNTPFRVTSTSDVPADQGGWLYLTFQRWILDHPLSGTPATTYSVWRKVPGTIATAAPSEHADADASRPDRDAMQLVRSQLPAGLTISERDGRLVVVSPGPSPGQPAASFPAGTWALVATVPALQQPQYTVVVPTVSNLASNEFVVTAQTTISSAWTICDVVTAQSVDNLAPATPASFAGAYAAGQTNLQWDANGEHDLHHYDVHRGNTTGFVPSVANRIGSPTTTTFVDTGSPGSFYKLSAVDVNGNVSGFALLTPSGTLDAGPTTPMTFALDAVRPNPATGRQLWVSFGLPSSEPARMELLDVSGRRVVGRDVGAMGPGRHSVNLGEARAIAAGLYWVRLTQADKRKTTRVAVVE